MRSPTISRRPRSAPKQDQKGMQTRSHIDPSPAGKLMMDYEFSERPAAAMVNEDVRRRTAVALFMWRPARHCVCDEPAWRSSWRACVNSQLKLCFCPRAAETVCGRCYRSAASAWACRCGQCHEAHSDMHTCLARMHVCLSQQRSYSSLVLPSTQVCMAQWQSLHLDLCMSLSHVHCGHTWQLRGSARVR